MPELLGVAFLVIFVIMLFNSERQDPATPYCSATEGHMQYFMSEETRKLEKDLWYWCRLGEGNKDAIILDWTYLGLIAETAPTVIENLTKKLERAEGDIKFKLETVLIELQRCVDNLEEWTDAFWEKQGIPADGGKHRPYSVIDGG